MKLISPFHEGVVHGLVFNRSTGGLAILDGTRLTLVSATTVDDGEQRLLQRSVGAAAGGR